MRSSRRKVLALAAAALATLAIGGCAGTRGTVPIVLADANPTGPCPVNICSHNPGPTYSYSPEPSSSESTEPPPSNPSSPRPSTTRRPTSSVDPAPGGTTPAAGPTVSAAPSQTKAGFVGVFAFPENPPPPPLPLDPPPPPSPLQTALPYTLVGIATVMALAAFFAIVRTVRSPATRLPAGASPAKG